MGHFPAEHNTPTIFDIRLKGFCASGPSRGRDRALVVNWLEYYPIFEGVVRRGRGWIVTELPKRQPMGERVWFGGGCPVLVFAISEKLYVKD